MTTPMDVFRLIERADERVKYAQNRDSKEAYRQARECLAEAEALLEALEDVRAKAGLRDQINRRRADLTMLEQR